MSEPDDNHQRDSDLELLHQRDYAVRVFRKSATELVASGTVHDQKPPGLYVEGDPDPLTIHRMTIELTVAYPSLEITDAVVQFGAHPQPGCPGIAAHYRNLVGLSIARGFTHKVRALFGGPRGCTHVTALLQAMAPALVQSIWSMRIANQRDGDVPTTAEGAASDGGFLGAQRRNIDTCHVWAADGELVALVEQGGISGPGIPVRERLEARGVDPIDWWESRG
jgi:hypothetical protein